jgi:hypothetical protein
MQRFLATLNPISLFCSNNLSQGYEALRRRQVTVTPQAITIGSHLPPAGAVADRQSLWLLGHGGAVDLGPRRWEGSALCFEGFVFYF